MKKAIILIGILLTVVIAMVGYYFMNKKQEGFQDQPQFEEVDTPVMDGKTEYIIKLTGAGEENNGIVRYLSSSGDDAVLSEEINGTTFKFQRARLIIGGNWFKIKRNDSKNFSKSLKYITDNPWTTEFQINSGGELYTRETSFNIFNSNYYLLVVKVNNSYELEIVENELGWFQPKTGNDTKIRNNKTKISFIKVFKTRPAQGLYRIKITSTGENTNKNVNNHYLAYGDNDNYRTTDSKERSAVFNLIHNQYDNESFYLKNEGVRVTSVPYYLGTDTNFGNTRLVYKDTRFSYDEDRRKLTFKYTYDNELYSLTNDNKEIIMSTREGRKDLSAQEYGLKNYKSNIVFENVGDVENLLNNQAYKIKLTYIGKEHESKINKVVYISNIENENESYKKTDNSDNAAVFKINGNYYSFKIIDYKYTNKILSVNNIDKKLGLKDDNDLNESLFKYDKYSKILKTNQRIPHVAHLKASDFVEMAPDYEALSIDKYRTLVEFEETTLPTTAAQTTAAAPTTTTTTPAPPPPTQAPTTTTTTPAPITTQAQTTAAAPETTQAAPGTTQALLGDEYGVLSKVKMTPEVRDYINSELNKYTDGRSLPTPEQIEQLKNILGNNTAEELAKIPKLLNNFKANTQSYMDFHKSYEEQLEEILRTKFDAEKAANKEIQKRNAVRLERLKREVEKYADINAINLLKQEEEEQTIKSGSLRNIGNGTMLNFDKTTDGNHVVLNMTGHKMEMQDGEIKRDPHGDIQGCLTFDSSNRKLGTPALTCCNLNNTQSPELSFRVKKISNLNEYNNLLSQISPETKELASEFDTINYPFQVVEPQQAPGYCVSVDDKKVRILPCEKDSNQRYRKLNYQVKNKCGQNTNNN